MKVLLYMVAILILSPLPKVEARRFKNSRSMPQQQSRQFHPIQQHRQNVRTNGDTAERMVNSVNQYRDRFNLPPLVMDPILMSVAQKRCPFASHCIHGKWMWQDSEIVNNGYWATDDIAMGYTDPEDCVRGWTTSDGHARQMRGQFRLNNQWVDRKCDRIGVARSGNNWIAIFGKKTR